MKIFLYFIGGLLMLVLFFGLNGFILDLWKQTGLEDTFLKFGWIGSIIWLIITIGSMFLFWLIIAYIYLKYFEKKL